MTSSNTEVEVKCWKWWREIDARLRDRQVRRFDCTVYFSRISGSLAV